jgi:ABC-2 type transport system permease protein
VKSLLNILWLGLKEIRSLMSNAVMVVFVIYAFTLAIYVQATGTSSDVNNASIAFVDEDQSGLSKAVLNAFYPPRFKYPVLIQADQVQAEMDKGHYMFIVVIPPQFELNLRAGRNPGLQVNIDATAMQQACIGAGYITNISQDTISTYLRRTDQPVQLPINLVVRKLFNPNTLSSWFKSVVAIINQITLLTVVLTGAAVIREREHGTLEHLLVMPLNAFEIAMAKVWANSLVILVATAASLVLVVQMALKVPFAGSVALWFFGVVLYLFFATALGVFLGTTSRTMAQFALLIILVILVLMLLSGGSTPIESQPKWLQALTFLLPARHFVSFS